MYFKLLQMSLPLFALSNSLAHYEPLTLHLRSDSINDSNLEFALNETAMAMGGIDLLNSIRTFVYQTNSIYRSHTLHQNYNLFDPDQSVAAAGAQNMSFEIIDGELHTRIDRSYIYDDYWLWAFPDLQPLIDYSVVIRGGTHGLVCFTKGQDSFFAMDPSVALGYADPYLTDYLIHQSQQFALPWLLSTFLTEPDRLQQRVVDDDSLTGQTYLEIEHAGMGLALLINTTSHLPVAVRSREDHVVYGNSTSDLVLSSWAPVKVNGSNLNAILLPHRIQTVYNSVSVLEDLVIDSITVNIDLANDIFDTFPAPSNPSSDSQPSGPSAPSQDPEYPRSEVHESFEAGLWDGPFGDVYNISNVVIGYPVPGLNEIMTIYVGDYPDYVQLLIEFEDGLLITDAPAHRSKIILDWVNLHFNGKRVTHVVPSHHHRDHAGGVDDYVAAGATLVVPEVARDFYNLTGRISKVDTYSNTQPFCLTDNNVAFRSFWKEENPHARDWSFGVASPAAPVDDNEFVVFSADVINPGTDATRWDTGVARRFVRQIIEVGVPKSAQIVGAHGSSHGGTSTTESLAHVANIIGIEYPPLSAENWNAKQMR